jgi:hypothetical protein
VIRVNQFVFSLSPFFICLSLGDLLWAIAKSNRPLWVGFLSRATEKMGGGMGSRQKEAAAAVA